MVWVIFIFEIVALTVGLISLGLILSGRLRLHMNSAQQKYFAHLTLFDHLSSALSILLNASAAIQLFRLRRTAFNLFATALVLNVILTIRAALTTSWLEAMGHGGISALLGFGLAVGILWYVYRLDQRGILS
jgi:hypothetical protein